MTGSKSVDPQPKMIVESDEDHQNRPHNSEITVVTNSGKREIKIPAKASFLLGFSFALILVVVLLILVG